MASLAQLLKIYGNISSRFDGSFLLTEHEISSNIYNTNVKTAKGIFFGTA